MTHYVSRKNIKQRIISEKIKTLILSVMWHTIAIYNRIIIHRTRPNGVAGREATKDIESYEKRVDIYPLCEN